MEKVLLAIEGLAPDRSTFSYALALCKRMRTGLDILQILSPRSYGRYLKKIRKSARHARDAFEDAMVAVTFAEAGKPDIAEQMKKQAYDNLDRLIPEQEKDDVVCNLTLKSGNIDEEILRYVSDHRDVVLTIFDAAGGKNEPEGAYEKESARIPKNLKKLPIPLVLRRGTEAAESRSGQGGAF